MNGSNNTKKMKRELLRLALGILGVSILIWSPNPHLTPIIKGIILFIVTVIFAWRWTRLLKKRKP
jgi:hypothetical protein